MKEESNGTKAILVSDLSALSSTLEEARLESGCYIPGEFHTLSLPSFLYHPFQGIAKPWGRKGDSS